MSVDHNTYAPDDALPSEVLAIPAHDWPWSVPQGLQLAVLYSKPSEGIRDHWKNAGCNDAFKEKLRFPYGINMSEPTKTNADIPLRMDSLDFVLKIARSIGMTTDIFEWCDLMGLDIPDDDGTDFWLRACIVQMFAWRGGPNKDIRAWQVHPTPFDHIGD